MTRERLSKAWAKGAFREFIYELLERIPPKTVALKRVERYVAFFSQLDAAFDHPKQITSEWLMRTLDVEGLRRSAIPLGFLVKSKIIRSYNAEALHDAVAHRHQLALLKCHEGKWFAGLLHRYLAYMQKVGARYEQRGWHGRRRRFVPRTIASNLRAAARLLDSIQEPTIEHIHEIEQVHVDRFMMNFPGYRDGISRFVRYLTHGEKLFNALTIESRAPGSLPSSAFLSKTRHDELVDRWMNAPEPQAKEALVCILMLLYGQVPHRLVKLRVSDAIHQPDGKYILKLGRTPIPLDRRISAKMEVYLRSRRALATMEDRSDNDYLFPGRSFGSHLSEGAVSYYLKKANVSAQTLFSTAIFNAYLTGMRHPKVLVRGLGISIATALRYIQLIDPRLRDEVGRKVAHG